MIRHFAIAALCTLAAPASAQDSGACVQDAAWWWQGTLAGYGPCERPQDGFLLLTCRDGVIVMDANIPLPANVTEGGAGTITLKVDSTDYPLTGEATRFPQTGNLGLGFIEIDPETLEALASGSRATFVSPNAGREIHLTGSRAATGALIRACGG